MKRVKNAVVLQIGEYATGSFAFFSLAYGIFSLCQGVLGWSWFYANMSADIIGWSGNYIAQRYWVFNNKSLRHHELRHTLRYTLLMLVNFVVDNVIIAFIIHLGVTPYLAYLFSAAFFTIWNYMWFRFVIFPGSGGKMRRKDDAKHATKSKSEAEDSSKFETDKKTV
ncbi:MAG: GtrA family protein [Candidatus Saccharimonadales bacterium]